MANTGIKGRIIYAGTNAGIPGLEVHAWNDDPFEHRIHLGKNVKTDNSGNFSITYHESVYRSWQADQKPSIRIQVFVPSSRLIYESDLHENVTSTELDLGDIQIHKNHIGEKTDPNSWLVTDAMLDPLKGDPIFLTQNNEVEWLVDGATMFPAVTKAAKAAISSINFMNLNFWVAGSMDSLNKNDLLVTDFQFTPPHSSTFPPLNTPIQGDKFEEILKTRAQEPTMDVRVVVGEIPLLPDTVEMNKKFFQSSSVKLKILNTGASLLHAKAVTIDDSIAFVVGSTFAQSYFSDQNHAIRDVTHKGSLMHDVSVKVTGPAVRHVKQSFATVWNVADNNTQPLLYNDPVTVSAPANPISLQILRTLSANGFKTASQQSGQIDFPAGVTSILESYQRAIANATEYIYIEDQYFTNRDVARAILLRMKEVPALEVILVVNVVPDMPGYTYMQLGIINQLFDELGSQKDKLGCYTLWSWQDATGHQLIVKKPFEILPIYIHSKTAMVDDKWATTGSANTDGSALNYIQVGNMLFGGLLEHKGEAAFIALILIMGFLIFSLPLFAIGVAVLSTPFVLVSAFKAIFSKTFAESFAGSITDWDDGFQHASPKRKNHPYRHAELNIAAFNNVAGQPQTNALKEFRENIWKEHLGLEPNDPLIKEAGSWLKLWNQKAEDKVTAVKNNVDTKIKIMKWKFGETPASHLKKLGIDNDKLNLREKADRFNYLTGQWEN